MPCGSTLCLLGGLLVAAGLAQRLDVLVYIKPTFLEWRDVIADRGGIRDAFRRTTTAQRLALEQLSALSLQASPGDPLHRVGAAGPCGLRMRRTAR